MCKTTVYCRVRQADRQTNKGREGERHRSCPVYAWPSHPFLVLDRHTNTESPGHLESPVSLSLSHTQFPVGHLVQSTTPSSLELPALSKKTKKHLLTPPHHHFGGFLIQQESLPPALVLCQGEWVLDKQ